MAEYAIYQCSCCKTGFVAPMPTQKTLKNLYNGFLTDLNKDKMPEPSIAASLFHQLGLRKKRNKFKMLDIGGGGGFFCKAFEDLDYGMATYVDLDPKSCQFAQKDLGLKRVYNIDAMKISDLTNEKYDFIYCRHLIEHLMKPTDFLLGISKMLTKNGRFVVQFSNGDSLEYLAYNHLNILYRCSKIRNSNKFSYVKTLQLMLFGQMLHGMDPPRHLWAITQKGISLWAQKNKLLCDSFARHIGDALFSPGFTKKNRFIGKLIDFIGQRFLSSLKGGTHLVAILRNQ